MATQVSIVSIVLLICLFQQQTSAFQFEDCSGKRALAQLGPVSLSSCLDTQGDYCTFDRGSNVTMTVDLMPTSAFTEAKISMAVKVGFIYVPFYLKKAADICGKYGLVCPAKVGQKAVVKLAMPVERSYPPIKTRIRFTLRDHKNLIACLDFPVKLK